MKEPNYKNNIEKMSVELWEIAIDVEERQKKLPFYDELALRVALNDTLSYVANERYSESESKADIEAAVKLTVDDYIDECKADGDF
jgi:hypothetical protein|nr:MAG TPA: hypothetical protein [Bacteriophage sp.]